MSQIISCPHCKTSLEVEEDMYGMRVHCPACSGKLIIQPPSESKTGSEAERSRGGWKEKDHANASFLISMLIGVGITIVFLLLMLPLKGMRLGSIFLERGWVNYAETLLFFWGMTIMVLKDIKNKQQREAALLNLFPTSIGKEINSETVGAFIDNAYKLPVKLRDSIIVNRIRKALELFESRNSNNETASFLQVQSDLDAGRSIGSYAFIKVFLWAIPILGFIGTVMGLSAAVGSLAMGDNTDPTALQSSINELTGGLGTAFDTTLLGLILSMLMSFPLSAVQKREEETLTLIDAFCTEKLMPRLDDRHGKSGDLIDQYADSLPEMVNSLARAHETFLVDLNASTKQLRESTEMMNRQLVEHQHMVEESFVGAVNQLSDTSNEIYRHSHEELDSTLKRLADGVEHLNVGLKKLGQDQIPKKSKRGRLFKS